MDSHYHHGPPPPGPPQLYSMQQAPPPHEQSYRPPPPQGPPSYHSAPPPQNGQYPYPPQHLKQERAPVESSITAPAYGSPVSEPVQFSGEDPNERRRYRLEVRQQPQRARMCGFGDKDRRPITPPPCIRLVITSMDDGKEIDINDVDHGFYVLNVDLWSADGQREVNLVRHAASPSMQPSLSYSQGGSVEPNTPVYSSSPMAASATPRDPYPPYGYPGTNGGSSQPPTPYGQYPGQQSSYPAPGPPQHSYPHQGGYPRPGSPGYGGRAYQDPRDPHGYPSNNQGMYPGGGQRSVEQYPMDPQRMAITQAQTPAGGMYTRNLIGSLSASAFRLTEKNEKIGIWFVLQDLSVRTEGSFRLRFSFVNVGATTNTHVSSPNSNGSSTNGVNTGKAPILASCYSDVFQVFSAKKFPGVVESTELSKCFATQGIKIPIRKDPPAGKRDDPSQLEEED